MTLPQNVKDAVGQLDYTTLPLTAERNLRAWQTISAHLLSQEAEIGRLQAGFAKHVDRVCELQSRLAAANALLRDMRYGAFNIGGWADAIDEYFQ